MNEGPDKTFTFKDLRATLETAIEPISKTIAELLQEVSIGNYIDFHRYLIQEGITTLALGGKAKDVDLMHLGKALLDTQVKNLDLSANKIDADSAQCLVQALQGTNVSKLCLDYNYIGANGAASVGKAIKDTLIKILYLKCNDIKAEGAESLLIALQGTGVTELYLDCNDIQDDGTIRIAKALQGSSLTTLSLVSNKIKALGAQRIGNTLKNTKLKVLNLEQNFIGAEGAIALVNAIQGSQLAEIYLKYNNDSDNEHDCITYHCSQRISYLIPSTLLIKVALDFESLLLKEALEKNQQQVQKVMMTPYYLASLSVNLTKKEKKVYCSNSSPMKEFGIFLNVGRDIQSHIFSYFPMLSMPKKLMFGYHNFALRKHDKEGKVNESKIVESNNPNLTHSSVKL